MAAPQPISMRKAGLADEAPPLPRAPSPPSFPAHTRPEKAERQSKSAMDRRESPAGDASCQSGLRSPPVDSASDDRPPFGHHLPCFHRYNLDCGYSDVTPRQAAKRKAEDISADYPSSAVGPPAPIASSSTSHVPSTPTLGSSTSKPQPGAIIHSEVAANILNKCVFAHPRSVASCG